jgi:hypothetical protein
MFIFFVSWAASLTGPVTRRVLQKVRSRFLERIIKVLWWFNFREFEDVRSPEMAN